jgi:hypothetical protein
MYAVNQRRFSSYLDAHRHSMALAQRGISSAIVDLEVRRMREAAEAMRALSSPSSYDDDDDGDFDPSYR